MRLATLSSAPYILTSVMLHLKLSLLILTIINSALTFNLNRQQRVFIPGHFAGKEYGSYLDEDNLMNLQHFHRKGVDMKLGVSVGL